MTKSMGTKVEGIPEILPSAEPVVDKGLEFLYATMVPAPKCRECGSDTEGDNTSGVAWMCPECGTVLSAHEIGVYPAKVIK